MSEDRTITVPAITKDKIVLPEEVVSQAEAARLRGISRERIRQLKTAGRFRLVTGPDGKVINGLLYKDDVINLERGKPGAPRLSAEELARRKVCDLEVEQEVIWQYPSRKGVASVTLVPATVLKLGRKRVCIRFEKPPVADIVSRGKFFDTAWVRPESLSTIKETNNAIT